MMRGRGWRVPSPEPGKSYKGGKNWELVWHEGSSEDEPELPRSGKKGRRLPTRDPRKLDGIGCGIFRKSLIDTERNKIFADRFNKVENDGYVIEGINDYYSSDVFKVSEESEEINGGNCSENKTVLDHSKKFGNKKMNNILGIENLNNPEDITGGGHLDKICGGVEIEPKTAGRSFDQRGAKMLKALEFGIKKLVGVSRTNNEPGSSRLLAANGTVAAAEENLCIDNHTTELGETVKQTSDTRGMKWLDNQTNVTNQKDVCGENGNRPRSRRLSNWSADERPSGIESGLGIDNSTTKQLTLAEVRRMIQLHGLIAPFQEKNGPVNDTANEEKTNQGDDYNSWNSLKDCHLDSETTYIDGNTDRRWAVIKRPTLSTGEAITEHSENKISNDGIFQAESNENHQSSSKVNPPDPQRSIPKKLQEFSVESGAVTDWTNECSGKKSTESDLVRRMKGWSSDLDSLSTPGRRTKLDHNLNEKSAEWKETGEEAIIDGIPKFGRQSSVPNPLVGRLMSKPDVTDLAQGTECVSITQSFCAKSVEFSGHEIIPQGTEAFNKDTEFKIATQKSIVPGTHVLEENQFNEDTNLSLILSQVESLLRDDTSDENSNTPTPELKPSELKPKLSFPGLDESSPDAEFGKKRNKPELYELNELSARNWPEGKDIPPKNAQGSVNSKNVIALPFRCQEDENVNNKDLLIGTEIPKYNPCVGSQNKEPLEGSSNKLTQPENNNKPSFQIKDENLLQEEKKSDAFLPMENEQSKTQCWDGSKLNRKEIFADEEKLGFRPISILEKQEYISEEVAKRNIDAKELSTMSKQLSETPGISIMERHPAQDNGALMVNLHSEMVNKESSPSLCPNRSAQSEVKDRSQIDQSNESTRTPTINNDGLISDSVSTKIDIAEPIPNHSPRDEKLQVLEVGKCLNWFDSMYKAGQLGTENDSEESIFQSTNELKIDHNTNLNIDRLQALSEIRAKIGSEHNYVKPLITTPKLDEEKSPVTNINTCNVTHGSASQESIKPGPKRIIKVVNRREELIKDVLETFKLKPSVPSEEKRLEDKVALIKKDSETSVPDITSIQNMKIDVEPPSKVTHQGNHQSTKVVSSSKVDNSSKLIVERIMGDGGTPPFKLKESKPIPEDTGSGEPYCFEKEVQTDFSPENIFSGHGQGDGQPADVDKKILPENTTENSPPAVLESQVRIDLSILLKTCEGNSPPCVAVTEGNASIYERSNEFDQRGSSVHCNDGQPKLLISAAVMESQHSNKGKSSIPRRIGGRIQVDFEASKSVKFTQITNNIHWYEQGDQANSPKSVPPIQFFKSENITEGLQHAAQITEGLSRPVTPISRRIKKYATTPFRCPASAGGKAQTESNSKPVNRRSRSEDKTSKVTLSPNAGIKLKSTRRMPSQIRPSTVSRQFGIHRPDTFRRVFRNSSSKGKYTTDDRYTFTSEFEVGASDSRGDRTHWKKGANVINPFLYKSRNSKVLERGNYFNEPTRRNHVLGRRDIANDDSESETETEFFSLSPGFSFAEGGGNETRHYRDNLDHLKRGFQCETIPEDGLLADPKNKARLTCDNTTTDYGETDDTYPSTSDSERRQKDEYFLSENPTTARKIPRRLKSWMDSPYTSESSMDSFRHFEGNVILAKREDYIEGIKQIVPPRTNHPRNETGHSSRTNLY